MVIANKVNFFSFCVLKMLRRSTRIRRPPLRLCVVLDRNDEVARYEETREAIHVSDVETSDDTDLEAEVVDVETDTESDDEVDEVDTEDEEFVVDAVDTDTDNDFVPDEDDADDDETDIEETRPNILIMNMLVD